MVMIPVVVGLPIADRRRSHAFYCDSLGVQPIGELAADGVPEPLQFALNDGLRIMLIPTKGFGWVVGGRQVAAPGISECVLTLMTESEEGVDEIIQRALDAGAEIIAEPATRPWGYTGTFADPDGHVWSVLRAM
jgi:uncharacterized protein